MALYHHPLNSPTQPPPLITATHRFSKQHPFCSSGGLSFAPFHLPPHFSLAVHSALPLSYLLCIPCPTSFWSPAPATNHHLLEIQVSRDWDANPTGRCPPPRSPSIQRRHPSSPSRFFFVVRLLKIRLDYLTLPTTAPHLFLLFSPR